MQQMWLKEVCDYISENLMFLLPYLYTYAPCFFLSLPVSLPLSPSKLFFRKPIYLPDTGDATRIATNHKTHVKPCRTHWTRAWYRGRKKRWNWSTKFEIQCLLLCVCLFVCQPLDWVCFAYLTDLLLHCFSRSWCACDASGVGPITNFFVTDFTFVPGQGWHCQWSHRRSSEGII